jgi:hypothetical protein
MRQFVRDEPAAFVRPGRILSGAEHNIPSRGVGERIHRLGRFSCLCVRVHAHLPEIMPEARLHEAACLRIKRLAGGAEDFVNNWRHL